jgi:hypothetical protein
VPSKSLLFPAVSSSTEYIVLEAINPSTRKDLFQSQNEIVLDILQEMFLVKKKKWLFFVVCLQPAYTWLEKDFSALDCMEHI